MTSQAVLDQRAFVRRALARVLVATLCIAALTAIGAILTGDFDETDVRVIASSLGFAVFSATAAAGASLRFRESENLRTLGLAAMASSAAAFLLLVVALWIDDGEGPWRWFGSAAMVALACSHASLVAGSMRPTDGRAVEALAKASIVLGVVDAFFGFLATSGAVDDVEDGVGQLVAVLVILLVLTTILPSILRRLEGSAGEAPAARPVATTGGQSAASAGRTAADTRTAGERRLAAEVLAAAERIDELNRDPGNRAAEIRRECERLRELGRMYSG